MPTSVRHLIRHTRRELRGHCVGPIRHLPAKDSICLSVPLSSGRELRLECRHEEQLVYALQSELSLPRPLSYAPETREFAQGEGFGSLLNGDSELLSKLRRFSGLTVLPGYRECLIRAEGRWRRRWWGGRSLGARTFLEIVDRMEAVLGGVCHGTSELRPVPDGSDPAMNVEDIFSTFGDLFGDFFGTKSEQSDRGADLNTELALRVEEANQGCKKPVSFGRRVVCSACDGGGAEAGSTRSPCPTCNGKGHETSQQGFFMVNRTCGGCGGSGFSHSNPCRLCDGTGLITQDKTIFVTVPAGVPEDATLRLKGMGNQVSQGNAGDLLVSLRLEEKH